MIKRGDWIGPVPIGSLLFDFLPQRSRVSGAAHAARFGAEPGGFAVR